MVGEASHTQTEAFGRPGSEPRWTSSTKEGIGTAYAVSSRVWFTLSHGVLNEVYFPTIDRPQIRDLEFLITDGQTFLHEEKRDLISSIDTIEKDTLGYRIVSEDPEKRYRLIKDFITDPHQPCVLIHVRLEGDPHFLDRLQVYALVAPHLDVAGHHNSGRRMRIAGREILVAWKDKLTLALGVNTNFAKTSCGFVGQSDGWHDLKDNFQMDWQFDHALDGNIALMGQVNIPASKEFTLALAFGDSLHAAVTSLFQTLAVKFKTHEQRFIEQWQRVCCEFKPLDKVSGDDGRLYRLSHNLLLAHEDKIFAGAFIASASIPWGEAKGDEDIGGYHLVWTRDMVKSAVALLAVGDIVTPMRALVYLACSQNPDGGFPQNFWIDGKPYWRAIQLDEVSFPIILAWRLKQPCGYGEFDPYPMVRAAAAYLVRRGPVTQQERWEENGGFSPSTLAAIISACLCAADFARDRSQFKTADFLETYADFLESHIETWTVTTQGSLVPHLPRYYIRINPATINDPVPNENPNQGLITIANIQPGKNNIFPARDIVDTGFLELVRYGIRKPDDPAIVDTLRVIDAVLKVDTPCGPVWHRYNQDGYGQRSDGGPYLGYGRGRAWPLLTGERGHYELAAGHDPHPYIQAMENFASKGGMLPEQVWDQPDLPAAGMFLGRPTGSAMPLMWAHAEYIKLLRSVFDRRIFESIAVVADRYLSGKGRKQIEIWMFLRQVQTVSPGWTLRIQALGEFRLRWTSDEWKTYRDDESQDSGLDIGFIDIPIPPNQTAPIQFTFFWTLANHWEGRNYKVAIKSP